MMLQRTSLALPVAGLAVALVLVASALAPAPVAAQSRRIVTRADTLADGGITFTHSETGEELTVEEKIAELNAKLETNPADGKAWNDLGVIYAQLERFDLARDAFIRAVQVDSEQGDFHRNLGLAFSRLGDHDMAAAEFKAYHRYDTMGGRDYWRLTGGALAEAGRTDEAREVYREGIAALEPDLGPEGLRLVLALNKLEDEAGDEQAVRDLLTEHVDAARRFLTTTDDDEADGVREARAIVHNRVAGMVEDAKVLEQSGLLTEAADMYREAYDLAPDRDDLLPRLVDVYIDLDRKMDARVAARLARDEHPDQAGTWIAAGRVYEQDRRLEDAVEAYKKAFAIDSSMPDLRIAIGNLLMRLQRDDEAREFLRAGVNAADTKPEVVYNYAVSLIRDRKYHAAIASLRSVVAERPDMVPAWSALAQCLRLTKQYGAAIEPYQKTLAANPDPKTAYNLGICAMKSKRLELAVESYRQALALDPQFNEARYNLALTYMDLERYEDAVATFQQLATSEPESFRVYYSLGLSYYYLGRYDEALEAYDLALEQKESPNVLNNIGLVYDKMGQKKEARKWYLKAKELQEG